MVRAAAEGRRRGRGRGSRAADGSSTAARWSKNFSALKESETAICFSATAAAVCSAHPARAGTCLRANSTIAR